MYKKEYSDDIVEIAEMDEIPNIVRSKGSGWVNTKHKPTLADLHEAQENEDEQRARKKIKKKVILRTESRDKEIMKDEGPRIRNKNGRMLVEHKRLRTRYLSGKSSASFHPTSKSNGRSRPKEAISNETALSQDSEIITMSELDSPFIDSDVVLCTPSSYEASSQGLESEGVVRKVSIAKGFASVLKEHQKDGVRFIWRNSFCDFNKNYNGDENDERVGGCILAHHMVSPPLYQSLTTMQCAMCISH